MKTNLFHKFAGSAARESFESSAPAPHYLVYYDGSLAALAALKAAIRMAEPGTDLTALSFVARPGDGLPERAARDLEQRAQAAAAAAVANAELGGVRIKTEIAHCRAVGPELIRRAGRDEASVIFLGVDHDDGSNAVNPLADYVLRHAPSQVVVVRL